MIELNHWTPAVTMTACWVYDRDSETYLGFIAQNTGLVRLAWTLVDDDWMCLGRADTVVELGAAVKEAWRSLSRGRELRWVRDRVVGLPRSHNQQFKYYFPPSMVPR